jgi:hypothetical protein
MGLSVAENLLIVFVESCCNEKITTNINADCCKQWCNGGVG